MNHFLRRIGVQTSHFFEVVRLQQIMGIQLLSACVLRIEKLECLGDVIRNHNDHLAVILDEFGEAVPFLFRDILDSPSQRSVVVCNVSAVIGILGQLLLQKGNVRYRKASQQQRKGDCPLLSVYNVVALLILVQNQCANPIDLFFPDFRLENIIQKLICVLRGPLVWLLVLRNQ